MTDLIVRENGGELAWISKIQDAYSLETELMVKFLEDHKLRFNTKGVEAWTAELARKLADHEISARTYNKKLSAVKNRLRLVLERYVDHIDPVQAVRFKAFITDMKPKKIGTNAVRVRRDKILTPEQIEELRQAAPPRLALMIEFLRDTGTRVSEMTTAGLGKVTRDGVVIEVIGKGQKMRYVTIEKDLYDRIIKEFGGTKFLFEHHGKPYSRIGVTVRLRDLSKKLWGEECMISSHVLRHSFITEALRRKVPIEQVADYVGHSSPDTTHRQYNHNVADWGTTFKDLMKPKS